MDATTIARVCHEANRAWCEAHGDFSQLGWDDAADWQRESALEGVGHALGGATPEELHELWCASKRAGGWTYGPRKNDEVKEHPCLVPYDELPEEQRLKDALFGGIVRALDAAAAAPASVVERIAELEADLRAKQAEGWGDGRELAIALTALEDVQMRTTRSRAKATGVFRPVDLERVEARAERERFEAEVGAAAEAQG